MSVLLQAERIRKTYTIGKTQVPVLKGASLSVEGGQTVSVVGVSGAGKSTFLNILAGLDRPDGGEVLVEGQSLYRISSAQRTRIRATRIGFVFQSYHLMPEMDVLHNVMLPSMALGVRFRGRPRERALDLLKEVGLQDRADHTPLELSGGEQQRVAIARALMNDPQLVLADEPTGNLDAATGGHVLHSLFSLARQRGHALVLVTHDRQTACLCDQVMVLQDGGLVTERR
jgi:ABC-type lipoprotein export system ATPase subunit